MRIPVPKTPVAVNDDSSAINNLNSFINECQSQSGKALTVADANNLVAAAQEIIALLQA